MQGIIHRLGVHARDEQAVGLDHDLRIRGLHREDDVLVAQAPADAEKLQRALHHAERRVAVAVHDAVAERTVVRADAQGAPELLAPQEERRHRLADALQLGVVVAVGILPHREFLFVRVVAGIDAHLLHVLDRLHRGGGQEMDVGHQRHVGEAGGGELLTDGLQAARGLHVGRGHADDLATHLGQGDGLPHRRGDVLGVARRHGLHADRIRAAHPDAADLHLAGAAPDGLKAGRGVGRAHGEEWSENLGRSRRLGKTSGQVRGRIADECRVARAAGFVSLRA